MSERAVSISVGYTLTVAITLLLTVSLLAVVGDTVDRRQGSVAHDELEVVGERVVEGIESADRLAATNATTVSIRVALPDRVAGSQYLLVLDANGGDPVLRLSARAVDASATVQFTNRTAVAPTRLDGGDVRVALGAGGKLEVRPA